MSVAESVTDDQPIRVAIGLIESRGRYLIRQRPVGSIMAGVWEFPGGKCESGEDEASAVRRECLEETGLEVELISCRAQFEHRYPHGFVRLTYFDCRPTGMVAEPLAAGGFHWVAAENLPNYRFPEANEPIIGQLSGMKAL